ncbi:MAG: outer membrane beta-barrel protein [Pseudomonadota bacterium]
MNERSTTPSARLLYRVGNKTQVFAGISRAQVRGGNSERDVTSYSAGVEIDASAITSGSFSVSSVRENFLEMNRGDLDYIGWEAEIEWKPRRFSTVKLTGGLETARGVFNLDDPNVSTVVGQDIGIQTNIDVAWRHFWRERFSTLASLGLNINDVVGDNAGTSADANDRTSTLRLQGDYNLRRWVDVGAFLVSESRAGDGEDRDYSRTVIGVTANGTF